MKKIFLFLVFCSFVLTSVSFLHADTNLIGNWKSEDGKERYDFMDGFAANKGIVLIYKKGKLQNVREWSVVSGKLKIGYYSKNYNIIKKDTLVLDKSIFSKQVSKKKQGATKIIELKKNTQMFLDTLVGYDWENEISQELYQYKRGFSSTTGIISRYKKKKFSSLGTWSFANGVIKIRGTVYPNARIAGKHLLLLSSSNRVSVLTKGKKSVVHTSTDLKKEKLSFIKKFTSGRWIQPSWSYLNSYQFRPTFGDLSGVSFVTNIYPKTNKKNYYTSRTWEFSPKTGGLKMGYNNYLNARIEGPYLILLKKDGSTDQYRRPENEKIKSYSHADITHVRVSEMNITPLVNLIEGQWFANGTTYKYVFNQSKKGGWLHSFNTYPFTIRGNTLKVDGRFEVKDVRFVDGKVVLGDNRASYARDSKLVYLKHQNIKEASKEAKKQLKKIKEITKIATRSSVGGGKLLQSIKEQLDRIEKKLAFVGIN
ncbi:MAG: hypothetical protein VX794_06950 [Nitrospinota bacterium]|nr:hypothetical protein [Nitrospinota bacterium]